MNRGLARRTVFETREDVRFFLYCVARAVRRGDLEVHAYCLMTNHFHMLVRSPKGKLGLAMNHVQNRFVRWFNRRNRRDGPLFRGRFVSRPVKTLRYRRHLVRYIDQNPVEARIVPAPELYPYGSAAVHAAGRGGRWLERSWIEEDALARTGAKRMDAHVYREAFRQRLDEGLRALIERRLHAHVDQPDPLDDLVGASPDAVRSWMQHRASVGDGTAPGLACIPVASVQRACLRYGERDPDRQFARGRGRVAAWPVLCVGLLRDLAGSSWAEICRSLDITEGVARRRYETHRAWLAGEPEYEGMVGRVGAELLGVWE